MTFMRKLTLLALLLAAGASACRGSDGDDAVTPDGNGSGTVDPNDVTIQEIQNDAMASGTAVKLKGVVVTAIDKFGTKKGDIWVQEPDGGEFSGIHVFGAPLDQVTALAVGDIVDIEGAQKDDFHYDGNNGSGGFEDGYAITELKPVTGGVMTVTKVSAGTPLEPQVVDALAIGQLGDYKARDAEWEKWEGVLVKVTNVWAMSNDKCVGSACNDSTLHSFDLMGGALVESALAAMPATAVKSGDCLTSVTGVVDYFFDYQILPRSTDEIATGGSSCPTEDSAATCGDGIDNDADGSKDCSDYACITVAASCRTVTTISQIQSGAVTGGVELHDVYVAALSKPSGQTNPSPKNMWVQTNPTAAPNEGVYVFGDGSSVAAFTPGTRVNIVGRVSEFNDMSGTETLTEINAISIEAGTAGTTPIVPLTGKNVTELSAEQYESTLVTLTNVKVKTVGTTSGANQTFGVGDADQYTSPGTAVTFKTDDDMYLFTPANTCYSSVTGIWTYLSRNDAWGFLPMAAGTVGTTCQ